MKRFIQRLVPVAIAMGLWLLATPEARALDKVAEYRWSELQQAGQVLHGTVEPTSEWGGTSLTVVADPQRPLIPLVVLKAPP